MAQPERYAAQLIIRGLRDLLTATPCTQQEHQFHELLLLALEALDCEQRKDDKRDTVKTCCGQPTRNEMTGGQRQCAVSGQLVGWKDVPTAMVLPADAPPDVPPDPVP